jgi:hypothetical protein
MVRTNRELGFRFYLITKYHAPDSFDPSTAFLPIIMPPGFLSDHPITPMPLLEK